MPAQGAQVWRTGGAGACSSLDGDHDAQRRLAVQACVFLFCDGFCPDDPPRVAEQIASKKFVAELSDLCTSKKTEPRVRAMVLRVLSLLAYEYQVCSSSHPSFSNLTPVHVPA